MDVRASDTAQIPIANTSARQWNGSRYLRRPQLLHSTEWNFLFLCPCYVYVCVCGHLHTIHVDRIKSNGSFPILSVDFINTQRKHIV